ncbi:MAG: hypothetical protein BWK73_09235 [Thiothrix lacustris]|uniref:Uncharacterized protein n=1 Tax=Thiothrix lacustris TaxID=525917 RepID=A0A1Y1QVY2_9GAMM|nr:MAG: hypothetical protein BWK73_09235 [Thiothrix lacustris]
MTLTVLVAFTAYESNSETKAYADQLDQRIAQRDQQIANADERMAHLATMQAMLTDLETDLSDLSKTLAVDPATTTTAVLLQSPPASQLLTDKTVKNQASAPAGATQ